MQGTKDAPTTNLVSRILNARNSSLACSFSASAILQLENVVSTRYQLKENKEFTMSSQEEPGQKRHGKSYQCVKCNFSAIHRPGLKLHVRAVHDKARDFPCEECDYKATQKGTLTRHVDIIHRNIKSTPQSPRAATKFSSHTRKKHKSFASFLLTLGAQAGVQSKTKNSRNRWTEPISLACRTNQKKK